MRYTGTTRISSIPFSQGRQEKQIGLNGLSKELEVSIRDVAITHAWQPLIYSRLAPYSIVSTPDHDLHRRRRNALNSFFSVASVRRLEPLMKMCMAKLLSRMEDSGKAREVVQMHPMFKASASDVINLYAFGDCMEFMDAPDWGLPYFAATDRFFGLTHVFALFPGIVAWAQSMPGWAVRLLAPSLSKLRDRQDVGSLLWLVWERC